MPELELEFSATELRLFCGALLPALLREKEELCRIIFFMPYRTIDPEEAEMMWVIVNLEKELAPQMRYPTAEEIGRSMDGITKERVRSLISSVNSGGHEYVCSEVRLKNKIPPGQPKKRGAPPATYHLAEMFMVRYPRTGLFLTEAVQFKKDENTAVNEQEFLNYMCKRYGFVESILQEDLDWCSRTHYINRFPSKKATSFQLSARTYAEIEWLKTLAAQHLKRK